MGKKVKFVLLVCLLLITFTLRFYKISQVPPSLYYDEVDYGYHARSLIQTFKDYRGVLSPFYVHSFNDIRTPIPAYFTVLTTLFFNSPELEVRMPSVILGTLVVLLAFLIIFEYSKNFWLSLIVGLVFATNPWQIQFSRFSHEGAHMLFIYMLGIYLFYKFLSNKNFIYLVFSSIVISLAVYTYRTMSLFVPLSFITLFILYFKQLKALGFKRLILVSFLIGSIILPFLYFTTIKAPDIPRINQLSITSDQEIPVWVQRNREIDSSDFKNPTIGKKAVWYSYFFHSKPLSYLDSFFDNYFKNFSTEFLFTKGDPNLRHGLGKMGIIYFIDIIPLIFGLYYVVSRIKINFNKHLIIWFLISPIPSSITIDGAWHGSRLFILSPPLLMIIGLGWWQLLNFLKNKKIILSSLLLTWLMLFIFYLHQYFIHYPIIAARQFGYGFKEAMTKIFQLQANFKNIELTSSADPPMIYYLFWSNTHPKYLQEYGTNFSKEIRRQKYLDKVKIVDLNFQSEKEALTYFKEDTLYLITQTEFNVLNKIGKPINLKFIDKISYPDNEVAFYIITKEN